VCPANFDLSECQFRRASEAQGRRYVGLANAAMACELKSGLFDVYELGAPWAHTSPPVGCRRADALCAGNEAEFVAGPWVQWAALGFAVLLCTRHITAALST